MRFVIALGGNALLQRGEPQDMATQWHNVRQAARLLGEVIRGGHDIVLTHGNGPQVGLLALQAAQCPLDILVAETQGQIGYMLQQALALECPHREVITLLTQTRVDLDDPAFFHPTKYIGPVYQQAEANDLAARHGWVMAQEGKLWRRVVSSPMPKEIIEINTIKHLIKQNILVIASGGGGIPVAKHAGSAIQIQGVEAVIDKDRTAALLAQSIDADALVILTDVAGVYRGESHTKANLIGEISVQEIASLAFPAGNMGPKVAAACEFVNATGRTAMIGALSQLSALLRKEVGTHIWQ
jgi:carbamate kinase